MCCVLCVACCGFLSSLRKSSLSPFLLFSFSFAHQITRFKVSAVGMKGNEGKGNEGKLGIERAKGNWIRDDTWEEEGSMLI